MQSLTGAPFQGRLEAEQLSSFNATQLQMMIKLYERIQMHVFRLMATDSVPKVRFHSSSDLECHSDDPSIQFTKTPQFVELRKNNEDYDFLDSDVHYLSNNGPSVPPGLAQDQEEIGGAYVTVSQQASNARARGHDAHHPQAVPRWDSR